MKKLLWIFAITVAFASLTVEQVKGQQMQAGIKGGLTLSNLYIDVEDLDDENARLGFNVGIYSQYMFLDAFGIQPEVLFTTKGSEATYTGVLDQSIDFNLSYIDVPIMLVLRPAEVFEIHAGPYVGFLLQSDVEFTGTIEGETELDRDHFDRLDYGLAAGIAFNFNALKVGLRYSIGLQEFADSNVSQTLLGDSKHSYAQLFISLNLARNDDDDMYY